MIRATRRGMIAASVVAVVLVSAFATTTMAAMTSPPSVSTIPSSLLPHHRFAVVGVGVLGTSLCRQILTEYSSDGVTGITKTTNNHESIRQQILGGSSSSSNNDPALSDRFRLVTNDEQATSTEKFPNVIFCAPPSGFDDYPAAVQEAMDTYWEEPDAGGVFVFTSSGAVYGPGDSGTVSETSPLADTTSSPRIARLVNAEENVLKAGGCCIRLAGLYNLERGPHNVWLQKGVVESAPDGLINMLHYDDAASVCVAAVRAGPSVCRGQAFLISDGHVTSRRDICASALLASMYTRYQMPTFPSEDVDSSDTPKQQPWALGKVYDGSASNIALQWSPKYKSFHDFMKSNA